MPSEIQFGLYVGGEFEKYIADDWTGADEADKIGEDYEHDCPQIDMRDMDSGKILAIFYHARG